MQILGMLIGLAGVVCFVMVLIKQFQNAGVVHGIIGIVTCGIWTFIWGWLNASKLNIRNLMLAWTIIIILCMAINLMFGSYYMSHMPTGSTL